MFKMAHILNIPQEILNNILSRDHLDEPELARAAAVCKRFRTAATPSLYATLGQRCCDRLWDKDDRRKRHDAFYASLHTLSQHKEMASVVREIHLSRTCLWENRPMTRNGFEPHVHEYLAGLIRPYHNLRFLHIQDPPRHPLPVEGLDLPQLQELAMRNPTRHVLDQLLQFPRLRNVHLYADARKLWDDRPDAFEPFEMNSSSRWQARKGKVLVISHVWVPPDAIFRMTTALKGLESVIFIQDSDRCRVDRYRMLRGVTDGYGCSRNRDIATSLSPAQASLEKLVLLLAGGYCCLYDDTVLGSLAVFSKLRNLKIEDTFFLGRHRLCDVHQNTRDTNRYGRPGSPFGIGRLLPSSLERFELNARQEEVARNEDYLADLLAGIFAEGARLSNLSYIGVDEVYRQGSKYCLECGVIGLVSGAFSSLEAQETPITEKMIRRMQRECKARRIDLRYVKRASGRGYRWNGRYQIAKVYTPERMGRTPIYLPWIRYGPPLRQQNRLQRSEWRARHRIA